MKYFLCKQCILLFCLASLRSELNHIHASAIEHLRQTHHQESAAAKAELEKTLDNNRTQVLNQIKSMQIFYINAHLHLPRLFHQKSVQQLTLVLMFICVTSLILLKLLKEWLSGHIWISPKHLSVFSPAECYGVNCFLKVKFLKASFRLLIQLLRRCWSLQQQFMW